MWNEKWQTQRICIFDVNLNLALQFAVQEPFFFSILDVRKEERWAENMKIVTQFSTNQATIEYFQWREGAENRMVFQFSNFPAYWTQNIKILNIE